MLDHPHRDRRNVEHLPTPHPDLRRPVQARSASPARHRFVAQHLVRGADLLQPRPRMPRLGAGLTATTTAQRLRRRLREPISARRLRGVARVLAELSAQLRVLRPQPGDHHVALGQRRDDHHELLPQPGELLTQPSNRSSIIGHHTIININRSRSSRHAAGDLTSYPSS